MASELLVGAKLINPLIAFLLWFSSCFVLFGDVTKAVLSKPLFKPFYIILVYRFIIMLLNGGTLLTAINNTISFICVVSPIFMYYFYKCIGTSKGTLIVFIVSYIAIYAYNLQTSLMLILLYGGGLRYNNNDSDIIEGGLYDFIYTLSLMVPPLLIAILNYLKNNEYKKMFGVIVIFLVFAALVLASLFMTAMVFMALGIFLTFILSSPSKKVRAITILVTIIVAINAKPGMQFLVDKSFELDPTNNVGYRMEEIQESLFGKGVGSTDDMGARNNLTMNSLNTFISHPLTGYAYAIYYDRLLPENEKYYGRHCAWIDEMALWGLFTFFFFAMMLKQFRYCYKKNKQHITYILCFIAMGFFNPIIYFPEFFAVFFLAPILIDASSKNEQYSI